MKSKLLDFTLNSFPIDFYAKIVLELLDKKSKETLVNDVKASMTKGELSRLNNIKLSREKTPTIIK